MRRIAYKGFIIEVVIGCQSAEFSLTLKNWRLTFLAAISSISLHGGAGDVRRAAAAEHAFDKRVIGAQVFAQLGQPPAQRGGLHFAVGGPLGQAHSAAIYSLVDYRLCTLTLTVGIRTSRPPAGLNFGDCFSQALAKAYQDLLTSKGDDFSRTDVEEALRDG